MSSLHFRLAAITETNLSVSRAAANLIAQLRELNDLREQVREAQLSPRRSRRRDNTKKMRKPV
jgi:hypothetical protein